MVCLIANPATLLRNLPIAFRSYSKPLSRLVRSFGLRGSFHIAATILTLAASSTLLLRGESPEPRGDRRSQEFNTKLWLWSSGNVPASRSTQYPGTRYTKIFPCVGEMPSRISGACNGCRTKKQKVRPLILPKAASTVLSSRNAPSQKPITILQIRHFLHPCS